MNLINELRMLAEDLHVNGYNRYSAAMSKAADELGSLQRYRTAYNEWIDKTEWVQESGPAKYLGMHRADALKDMISELEERCATLTDALRAKVEKMERQEPFDADSDAFRIAFEAALKAGNWPATRQGDGYRSPPTQIAWRIAFSTVNRLKLYLAPGAQPAPNLPVDLITDYLVSISAHVAHQDDPKAQAEIGELLRMLASAPEAKP